MGAVSIAKFATQVYISFSTFAIPCNMCTPGVGFTSTISQTVTFLKTSRIGDGESAKSGWTKSYVPKAPKSTGCSSKYSSQVSSDQSSDGGTRSINPKVCPTASL